ncbi:MAG: response regulator transcription factor [Microbispora sp.]|nr:response regulator transcription factor [Microbispora sp.]
MPRSEYIDVLVVDDHEVAREGIKIGLAATGRCRVVADVADGRAALRAVRELEPDVAVVDMRLHDMPGTEVCARIRELTPRTRILMLSGYLNEGAVRSALRAGAHRYVGKAAGMAELVRALDEIADGAEPASALDVAAIVKEMHGGHTASARCAVSPRQEQVLELAAQGLTDREIGHRLYLAESTVRFHIQRLKTVLDARTKTEVVAKAIRLGIIAPALEA